ncbi:putative Nucleoside-diphosphate sugar epimerases [Magnetospira sp. QH-2]|nr:putative Nucleoside-diphosphate sugar epimerases [Magnetospira sp. QH-2]
MTAHLQTSDPFLSGLLGRDRSLLAEDMAVSQKALNSRIIGTRLLVVGAAGSIGAAVVRQLAAFAPATLHLVDLSENNLVELVRDLRSSDRSLPEDFRTFAVSFGSEEFRHLLAAEGPYDYLINFAALKHVRSERDVYSLMRMIETNAGHLYDLLTEAELAGGALPFRRAFSISTDKASHPTNAMGASKCLMERVHLCHADRLPFATARFANVAFSDGSLLQGWERRIEKRQPLAAPSDIRRYFFSHEEAGQLCLLGCFLCGNREVVFPKLTPDEDLMPLSRVAEAYLAHRGFEPLHCTSEEEARARAAELTNTSRRWPCLFTPSDTSGEKSFEEFFAPDDDLDLDRFKAVGVIRGTVAVDQGVVEHAMTALRTIRALPSWSKSDVIRALQIAVPEFVHAETDRNLDQKI